MGKRLGLCLVGCGRVSSKHFPAIKELQNEIDLVAVVDTRKEVAGEAKDKWGARKYYPSLEEALKDKEIEAVDICLPNYLHCSAVVQVAKAGRHILVEKPLANTLREADQMIEEAKKNGVILMVGQSRRFFNAVLESKDILDKGKIGKLININAKLFGYLAEPPTEWWKSAEKAGGLIIPIWGSHIIDYILWMYGEAPARVYCEAYSNNSVWEGEDEVCMVMGFKKGGMASIIMSWNIHSGGAKWEGKGKILSSRDIGYERYIVGSEATLHLIDETELRLNEEIIVSGKQKPNNFYLEIKEFTNAIKEKRTPLTSGKEIRKVIEVQEASLKSAEEHKVIYLKD